MQCKRCGANLSESDKFCQTCGGQVINDSSPSNIGQPSVQPTIMPESNVQQPNVQPTIMPEQSVMQQPSVTPEPVSVQQPNIMQQSSVGPEYNNVQQSSVQEPVSMPNNNYSNDAVSNSNLNNYQPLDNGVNNSMNTNVPKKKNPVVKILLIVGGIILGIIILAVIIILVASGTSDKIVCKSNEGNITIMYNDSGITGYTGKGLTYNLDKQKEYAKQIGMDAYIVEFNSWFEANTSGTCTVNGKKVESSNKDENTSNSNVSDTVNSSNDNVSDTVNSTNNTTATKSVGDSTYGYVEVPYNWVKFYDIDGNDSLQYSYGTTYIISLNYMKDNQYTAKEYASNYMYNKENDSSVTGVTGATVTIGKNKKYTAYQVYMYYPAEKVYLITYWFEAEDGKVHYLALEGPSDVTDYVSIPESFSLNS